MKHLLLVCCFLHPWLSARAVEISVGGTQLLIPAPAEYSLITDEMKPYAEVAKRFVPPSNEQFALFLPDADVAMRLKVRSPIPSVSFMSKLPKR